MSQIKIDEGLQKELAGRTGSVELVAPNGELVAVCLTPQQHEDYLYRIAIGSVSMEELDAAAKEGGAFKLKDILKELEQQ